MSTQELKKQLINKIEEVNDKQLLESAMSLLQMQEDKDIHVFSPKEMVEIAKVEEEVANGEYLTDEASNAAIGTDLLENI